MTQFQYTPQGTCSKLIDITVADDGRISSVKFHGGCPGNTVGVAALVCGLTPAEAAAKLRGIRCGVKSTSCPDQLALALDSIPV